MPDDEARASHHEGWSDILPELDSTHSKMSAEW